MNRYTIAIAFVAMIVTAGPSFGQRKPDAPPINDQAVNAPNIDLFTRAYERAGEPTLLVICGIDSRPLQTTVHRTIETGSEPQAATGTLSSDRHVGSNIALFDPSGDSTKLKGDIEEILLNNPDIDLISIDALAERDRREVELLKTRNEKRAINLLASKLNAEVVLLVRMTNTTLIRQRGALYRVTVEILDIPRGRKIGGFTFDWKGKVDSISIKKYARQITRKFIDQFSSWYARGDSRGAARRYTLRMIGLSDVGQLVKAQRAFSRIDGVTKIKAGGFSSEKKTSIATLNLRYTGRPIELMFELQETARQELGMKVDGTDGASGTITLIAKGTGPADDESRWEAFVDPDHPDHSKLVTQLQQEYAREGRPKIGMMINRLLSETEIADPRLAEQLKDLTASGHGQQNAPSSTGAIVNLNLGSNPGLPTGGGYSEEAQRARDRLTRLLNTRQMEDALYKHLLKLKLTMVDPVYTRERLHKKVDKARNVYREDELVFLLGQAAGVDIVIQGVGRVDQTSSDYRISYTFRAVRVSDGVTLAAEGWPTGTQEQPEDSTVEAIAKFATGRLVDQMLTFWSSPQTLTVKVTNAKTQRDVFVVMNMFKENVPGVLSVDFDEHEAGSGGGTGVFSMRYRTTYDELIHNIAALEGKLPLGLGTSNTRRDTLTVKITDGL